MGLMWSFSNPWSFAVLWVFLVSHWFIQPGSDPAHWQPDCHAIVINFKIRCAFFKVLLSFDEIGAEVPSLDDWYGQCAVKFPQGRTSNFDLSYSQYLGVTHSHGRDYEIMRSPEMNWFCRCRIQTPCNFSFWNSTIGFVRTCLSLSQNYLNFVLRQWYRNPANITGKIL